MKEKLEPEEVAFTQSLHAVFLRESEMSFEETVREYRRIELEFVQRAGADEWDVLETKRRISEWLLRLAFRTNQPHEVCREIWDELVQRGFSNKQQKHIFTGIYARCCQDNGEFDAGLAVLEPLIAESEEWLQHATITPEMRSYWERDLAMDYEIRDELRNGIRQCLMPRSGKWKPEEIALTQRINAIQFRERSSELSFEQATLEYRQVEADFVALAGDDEAQILETKRRVVEVILESAYETSQPHEICRALWEELVQLGFSNVERRHSMSDTYVRCCQSNGEFDTALALLEPLIAELERCLADTTLAPEIHSSHGGTLRFYQRLRDKLKAGIRE